MGDIAEGIGGAIEGALTGRAVEPGHGKGGADDHGPGPCANCGAQVSSTYCPECGQKRHVHRTLSAIGHDLIHGVLHLDGKFWNTLPLLAFKPGQLTRRYIDGERAKFVSPMAMFLFTVFAMFAVFQMVGLSVPTTIAEAGPRQLETAIGKQAERIDASLKDVEEQLAEEGLTDEKRVALQAEQQRLIVSQKELSEAANLPIFANGEATGGPKGDGATAIGDSEIDGSDLTITGIEALDKGLIKKWQENPSLMLYKLQSNAYKFSWLLIPLSIPFVWLLFFWKRRFRAYDHAVFVTYSLSFMSLLFIAASLITRSEALTVVAVFMMLLVPPLHLYKQLRGTYELSRWGAFWRLMVISLFIWLVILLFLEALLMLGAF